MHKTERMKSALPPIVRLSVINPFLQELRDRGLNARQILVDMELPPGVPASPEFFVPIATMYKLVEATAAMAEDRCFGFMVGGTLDIAQWDPIAKSAEMSTTVSELLTHFVDQAREHATAQFFLRCEPARSTFGFERPIRPPVTPAQNDAFYAGMLDELMQKACGDAYDASQMLALVSDPTAIPKSWQGRVGKTDVLGPQISFPTKWIFKSFNRRSGRDIAPVSTLSDSLLHSMDVALRPYLAEEGLSAERAAALCGYSRRTLSNELRKRGTTIGKQIAALRAHVAIKHLTGTNERIAEIGRSVGYPDATVFSRAFKHWTGQSPTEYRRAHKALVLNRREK